jgi:DNA-binding XRE family transcriptional regulator
MRDHETSLLSRAVTNHPMSHPNYLAAHRKRWALTKQDLAHLIGYHARDPVSRCETSLREPTIRLVLGCEVVFGLSTRALFPGFYAGIEDTVMERAAALDRTLRGREDAVAERKRELLRAMVERAVSHPAV